MTTIQKIINEDISAYLNALRLYIKATIDLPSEAINYFSDQWTEERILINIDNWLFLIAKENDKINGVLLGTPLEGGVGTIIWLLVDKQNQNKGIGGLLFKEACSQYKKKGAHKVKLTVPDFEIVSFYIKQGMLLEGTHKNHWWGADFWAMGKNL